MYEYRAEIRRVVDGDTLRVDLDLGRRVHIVDEPVRLVLVDAPEMPTAEGQAAKRYVERLVTDCGARVMVRTHKDRSDPYGRLLADVWWPPDTATLSSRLLQAGHADPYGS